MYAAKEIDEEYDIELGPSHRAIIDPIIEGAMVLEPEDIVNDVHHDGGPWDIIYKRRVTK